MDDLGQPKWTLNAALTPPASPTGGQHNAAYVHVGASTAATAGMIDDRRADGARIRAARLDFLLFGI
jgi:hypothetical protein